MTGRPRALAAEALAWARKYPLAPRYPRPQRRVVLTDDGVRLHLAVVPGPPDPVACVVLVHGFAGSSRSPSVYGFAHELARRAVVVVPDLRGHRASDGRCTLGLHEPRDVAAAVKTASVVAPGLPVVTIGVSLGAIAVLRHAGAFGGVAGTVGISAPATWGATDGPDAVRLAAVVGSRSGRLLLRTLCATRLTARHLPVPDGSELLASIAPAFTLVVHDPHDTYFGPGHAEQLHDWAREPKGLWMLPGAGHGSDMLTPSFAGRLLSELEDRLSGRRAACGPGSWPSPGSCDQRSRGRL